MAKIDTGCLQSKEIVLSTLLVLFLDVLLREVQKPDQRPLLGDMVILAIARTLRKAFSNRFKGTFQSIIV